MIFAAFKVTLRIPISLDIKDDLEQLVLNGNEGSVGDQGEGDSGLLQDPSGFIGAVLAFDLALAADGGAQQALGVVFL